MLKKELMTIEALTPPKGQIHFKTSKAMSGVNFFDRITDPDYDFSFLEVYVNDELTNIPANALTAAAGDDIKIVSLSKPYPFFSPYNKDYIASIEEPLPLFMDNTDFSRYFYNCRSLVSIPEGLFDNNPNVNTFRYCFYNCSALTSIPIGLFDNNPNVTNFYGCFRNCTSLTSIPQGLFDNNPNVTGFNYCFETCWRLTSIPQGLFDNNPNVTGFSNCFCDCFDLTSIPEGLFDNNPNVTNFDSCFNGCRTLTSIPEGLFDNNPNVTNFDSCFCECASLTSIPIGLFDKNTKVTDISHCFMDCTKLTVNVQIGSTTTSRFVDVNAFALRTVAKGTVYCRAGSNAYNAFLNSSNANVNVLTY